MQQSFDEHTIVRQVLAGNPNAFAILIRQYEGLVLHIVTPIIGVHADREDLCQDIFVKVYEKLHTFQHRAKLSTWIGQIAYHMSINFIRRKQNVALRANTGDNEKQLSQLPADFDTAEDIMIREDQLDQLTQSINQLNPAQQTALLLFYQDEMSLEEISQVMQLPMNTVKSHLFRAKANLRKQFQQHEH